MLARRCVMPNFCSDEAMASSCAGDSTAQGPAIMRRAWDMIGFLN